jgi:hypothetical protein
MHRSGNNEPVPLKRRYGLYTSVAIRAAREILPLIDLAKAVP